MRGSNYSAKALNLNKLSCDYSEAIHTLLFSTVFIQSGTLKFLILNQYCQQVLRIEEGNFL